MARRTKGRLCGIFLCRRSGVMIFQSWCDGWCDVGCDGGETVVFGALWGAAAGGGLTMGRRRQRTLRSGCVGLRGGARGGAARCGVEAGRNFKVGFFGATQKDFNFFLCAPFFANISPTACTPRARDPAFFRSRGGLSNGGSKSGCGFDSVICACASCAVAAQQVKHEWVGRWGEA